MGKRTVNILGLGPTLKNYKKDKNLTIGVNDICTFIKVDVLVLQDPPYNFTYSRYENIYSLPPALEVFSSQPQWSNIFEVKPVYGIHENIKPGLDSTYLAIKVAVAYFDAKVINLYGVDFTGHPELTPKLEKLLSQYEELALVLKQKGITLTCQKGSALEGVKNITPIET